MPQWASSWSMTALAKLVKLIVCVGKVRNPLKSPKLRLMHALTLGLFLDRKEQPGFQQLNHLLCIFFPTLILFMLLPEKAALIVLSAAIDAPDGCHPRDFLPDI